MSTLVYNEMAARCASIVAFVAGVWTLAGMRTLVSSDITASCTSKIAVVTFVLTFLYLRMIAHFVSTVRVGKSRSFGLTRARCASEFRKFSTLGVK